MARNEFQLFVDAQDARDAFAAFQQLLAVAGLAVTDDLFGPAFYESLRNILLPQLPYKFQSLFATLTKTVDAAAVHRIALADPSAASTATAAAAHASASSGPASALFPQGRRQNILVSGAGPCGLRAALEAVLVGHHVRLIELRDEFSRPNVLKTWQPNIDDLVRFGFKTFVPRAALHGLVPLHTKDYQMCLLKAALLMGVRVHLAEAVCGLLDPSFVMPAASDSGTATSVSSPVSGWRVWALPAADARLYLKRPDPATLVAELSFQPSDVATEDLQKRSKVDFVEPAVSRDGAVLRSFEAADETERALLPKARFYAFDSLLVAEGESSRLIRRLGFDRKVQRFAEAIGLVANFEFTPNASAGSPERQLKEFLIWRASALWRQTQLGPLADKGIDFENLEYMRGTSTHFFAATTRIKMLVDVGIVKERRPTVRESLQADNMNFELLRDVGRTIARLSGIPDTAPFAAKHGIQVFDFSCRGLCVDPFRWIDAAPSAQAHRPALVLPIGDALQNPYWPQGLGVNRGVQNALDAVWMAHVLGLHGSRAFAEEERRTAFKAMDWTTFEQGLLRPAAGWSIDPLDRYASYLFASIHNTDIEQRAPFPSLPQRYRDALKLTWTAP
ncbi:hypothetical protein BC831DRAFT_440730 [Entophlyctis helioformis]|nr:hypothetical protein BC831DRAFT_440730 [Entophlyctis helioformis]